MNRFSTLLSVIAAMLVLTFTSCDYFPDDRETEDEIIAVTGIILNSNEIHTFIGEDFHTLSATLMPGDAANQKVEWTTSDPLIVTFSEGSEHNTIHLNCLSLGEATITATTEDGGFEASCKIVVSPVSVHFISFDRSWVVLPVGRTANITYTIYPDNATNQIVRWETSDPDVIKVEEDGSVVAVSAGEAVIKITSEDGDYWSECNVEVTPYVMTLTAETYINSASYTVKGQSSAIYVDWGDGTIEYIDINNIGKTFTHNFTSDNPVVTIAGSYIEGLSVFNGKITSIDVSGNPNLTILSCIGNSLTTLDVSKNPELTELSCDENQLTKLDLSKNVKLTDLSCRGNRLNTLDVSANSSLSELSAQSNQLTSLELGSAILRYLDCSDNRLTTLTAHKLNADWFDCSNNNLTTLVLGEGSVSQLNCSNNRLTELDMSKVRAGGYFELQNNLFEAAALNAIFTNLPKVPPPGIGGKNIVYISGNPGATGCNTAIATAKEWSVEK